jgi:hypothetical protein
MLQTLGGAVTGSLRAWLAGRAASRLLPVRPVRRSPGPHERLGTGPRFGFLHSGFALIGTLRYVAKRPPPAPSRVLFGLTAIGLPM